MVRYSVWVSQISEWSWVRIPAEAFFWWLPVGCSGPPFSNLVEDRLINHTCLYPHVALFVILCLSAFTGFARSFVSRPSGRGGESGVRLAVSLQTDFLLSYLPPVSHGFPVQDDPVPSKSWSTRMVETTSIHRRCQERSFCWDGPVRF